MTALYTITIDDDDRDNATKAGDDRPFVATIVRHSDGMMFDDSGIGATVIEAVQDLLDDLSQMQSKLEDIA